MFSIGTDDYGRVSLQEKNNFISNPVDFDKSIFKTNCFEYKYDERKVYYDENYKTPREIYEEIQAKQGVIGKLINTLKNNFSMFNLLGMKGSNAVEEILEQYENGDILEYIAQDEVEKYNKNQTMLKELVLNIITLFSLILGFSLSRIFEIDMGSALTLICTFSGAIRFAGEKLEMKTNSLSTDCKKQMPLVHNFAQ